ncbi:aldehyde dehydrogenase family protein [Haloarchaeobius sp. DFWS5]|uniref:aldehyde dehydrogenase family protein n=1 Tax=Haloarchaeobius sp. DFWS5 TaxID=3446114 RepID=UPI003EBFAC67
MSLPDDVLEKHRSIAADVIPEDEYGHLVGGEWVESSSGETQATTDATTGEALARFQSGTPEDVDRAVEAAQDAYDGSWGEKTPQQRAQLLHEIADELEAQKTRIARLDSLEVGKPNKHSLFVDTTIVVDQFRHFASLARTADEGRVPPSGDDKLIHTRQEPYGVIGCISAWNFPAMFVAWKLGPALAAGNSVVYKPSSRAVLSTLEIAKIVDRILPPGALNVVTGAGSVVGDAITGHEGISKVSLTGGTGAGQAAMRNAAEHIHPVSLELGGKSPNIVFSDADLDEAVEGTLVSIFFNQGQQCTAGSRLFLHEDVREAFMERFAARVEELTVGDPLSPLTDIGPMVDADHRDDVQAYVDGARESGATALLEKAVPDELADAPFVTPTVFGDVADDDTISCEEVFGPVLSTFEFSTQEEAVERANDTEYGLAAGVWTSDLNTAHEVSRDLEAGMVWVNTYNDMFEPAPYGGYKQSGIGRELAVEAMAAYQQTKTVKMSFGDIPNLG